MILSDLRFQHNLTQEEVCTRCNLPYNTYRRYEYGDTFPKRDAIVALADLYNMLPGELFQLLIDGDVIGYPREKELMDELDAYYRWRDGVVRA